MGNSASSARAQQEDSVDYGYLIPQGVYTGTPDWNQQIVARFIIERRLAPFYRPLEEYDDNWDDEQILAARKPPLPEDVATSDSASRSDGIGSIYGSVSRSNSAHSSLHSARRPGALKEPSRLPEAMVYRGAIECPICFLYYPPNINRSRCCDQAICTECFVQIKRSEPTTTHVVSEPAACPYCVQENFGVTYTPPAWRAGIGADASHTPITVVNSRGSPQQSAETNKGRRKSFGADSAEVVTIDHIRPDWEAKLAAVRAAVARRANRRIIMRQVGDRLIPVGVTSGRIHPLNGEAAVIVANGDPTGDNSNENEGRSRRSRRRQHQQQPQDINQLLGSVSLGGQDLEELMVMEAMRLSLLEHEERQKKEAEEKKKREAELRARGGKPEDNTNGENEAGPSSSASGSGLPSIPMASPIDVAESLNRNLLPISTPSPEGRSVSSSPRTSSVNRGLAESNPNPRQSETSALHALAATSLRVSSAHAGSNSHSRSGSVTPSVRSPTPRENVTPPPFGTLNAALATHGAATGVLSVGSDESNDNAAANVPQSSTFGTIQGSDPQNRRAAPMHPQVEETSGSTSGVAMRAPPTRVDTSFSSLFTGDGEDLSYDTLPSSPDSPSHRPLLTETPVSEVPGQFLDAATAPEPRTGASTG